MANPIIGIPIGKNIPCDFPHCKPLPEADWAQKEDNFDPNREFERRTKERAGHSSWATVNPSRFDPAAMTNREQSGLRLGGQGPKAHPLLADNPAFDGADPRLRVTPDTNPDGQENYHEELQLQHALQPGLHFAPKPSMY